VRSQRGAQAGCTNAGAAINRSLYLGPLGSSELVELEKT
jgi:hypothetical protein